MRSPRSTVLLAVLLVAGSAGVAACSAPAPATELPATAIQVRRILSHAGPGEPDPFTTEAGAELLRGREGTRAAGSYWVGPPELDGTAIATADLVVSTIGDWDVRLTLTPAGSAAYVAFADFFSDPQIAIVVDGQVVSAQFVLDPIDSSAIVIEDEYSAEEKAVRLLEDIRGN